MTPEQAAERAAEILAIAEHADNDRAIALVVVADGWTRLHIALANAPTPQPPTDTRDRREQAREWITSFMSATDDDRVNCVALLLCAADDALECALIHKRTEGSLPPSREV